MALDIVTMLPQSLWGNTGSNYLVAAGVFLAVLLVLRIFREVIIHRLAKLATKTKNDLDDTLIEIVKGVCWPFYVIMALYFSMRFLETPEIVQNLFKYVAIIAVTYYAVKALQAIVDYFTRDIIRKRQEGEALQDASLIKLMSKAVKYSLWFIAGIFLLSNLGYDISSLIAGLGIGGIAVALALQNVLGDIFSSFSIYFDRPFKVGDFIIVGSDMGTVKKIGLKSTRIQTLQGEELVISNKELTTTRIQNFKKMEKRRVEFNIGVTYDTPVEKLKKIPGIVAEAIESVELTDLDRVHFKEFGDFSLNYNIVYYTDTPDYSKYMDTRQEINLKLKERFEKEKIEFAFPTQTIYVSK